MHLKPTLLLAAALFLMSAPEPDSRTVAEMTANFIVPTNERALQAADLPAVPDIANRALSEAAGEEPASLPAESEGRPDSEGEPLPAD